MNRISLVWSLYSVVLLTLVDVSSQQVPCQDTYSKDVCQAYVQTNQCIHVWKICTLSCGRCPATSSSLVPVPSFNGPTPSNRIPPVATSCVDTGFRCSEWSRAGFCSSISEVQNSCRRTCNLCVSQPVTNVGVWRPWGAWGSCSVTCGEGKRIRRRACSTFGCVGINTMTEACFQPRCPNDRLGPWRPYGPCSVTCGNGYKTRYRECLSRYCSAPLSMTTPCTMRPCGRPTFNPACTEPPSCGPTIAVSPNLCERSYIALLCKRSCNRCGGILPGAIGIFGSWSKFGPCSKTCGKGTKTKTRKCLGGLTCIGSKTKKESCQIKTCPTKKIGTWGRWGKYSVCSEECGGGTQMKKRTCLGIGCKGSSTQSRRCNARKCKGTWDRWSPYGKCTRTCGPGTKTRSRKCKSSKCEGSSKQTVKCQLKPCNTPDWGTWRPYGECSKKCGGGTQTRTRDCVPKGAKCSGSSKETRKCNIEPCDGGSGDWSPCTKSCGTGTRYRFDSSTCTTASNPMCFRTFEECNTSPCADIPCPPGTIHRFDSKHACCSNANSARIISGFNADITKFPWMAMVETSDSQICGGALLNEQWVMTAGHCVKTSFSQIKGTKVYLGIQNFSERGSTPPLTISKVVRHENFDPSTLENDIALIKLSKTVPFFDKIRPIALPHGEETPTDTICYVTGWGLTEPDPVRPRPSEPLLYTGVQMLDTAVCHKPYSKDSNVPGDSKEYIKRTDKLLCAGSLSKKTDTCRGDSGGPLVCQRCSSCEWYVAGITSFGPPYDCGRPGYPGMYLKVKEYEDWIYKSIPFLRASGMTCSRSYGP